MNQRLSIVIISLVLLSIFLAGCGQTPNNSCKDSDGGKNVLVKGTCTTPDYNMTDFCTESGKVEEYYCNSHGGCDSAAMDCSAGCNNGTCIGLQDSPYSGNAPQINEKDLKCGAYYGAYNQKKPGTPDDWVYSPAGRSSYWHAPGKSIGCPQSLP